MKSSRADFGAQLMAMTISTDWEKFMVQCTHIHYM
jgi:hypothetical protein